MPRSAFAELAPIPPDTGVIAIAKRPSVDVAALPRRPGAAPIVLLEAPAHLGNVGAVVRVAAAAGAAAVVTTGAQDPWHPAALRGAAGLHFALPVARTEGVPALRHRPLLAMHPDGECLRPDTLPDGAVLAFGSERRGLSDGVLAAADRQIALPMRPGVSSLNLASAVAAVLYAWRLAGGGWHLPQARIDHDRFGGVGAIDQDLLALDPRAARRHQVEGQRIAAVLGLQDARGERVEGYPRAVPARRPER